MLRAVKRYAFRASHILAVGTCACYGGMAAGAPNPTGAHGVGMRLAGKSVINLPGCPTHPDWVVGTIAYLIANGQPPALDSYGRPTSYFSTTVHQRCPMRGTPQAQALSQQGCLQNLGCKGRYCKSDCPVRQWNAGAAGQYGANWCVGAGAPCYGCVEPNFPDGMSPFYTVS